MTEATFTLMGFLLARIAEDEAAARAAPESEWVAERDWSSESQGWGLTAATTRTIFVCCRDADGVPEERRMHIDEPGIGVATEAEARHIARFDPTRVLAECEAKRRIVEVLESVSDGGLASDAAETAIRALTAVYADHPDYREEWRP